jgi:hypothetical protein
MLAMILLLDKNRVYLQPMVIHIYKLDLLFIQRPHGTMLKTMALQSALPITVSFTFYPGAIGLALNSDQAHLTPQVFSGQLQR